MKKQLTSGEYDILNLFVECFEELEQKNEQLKEELAEQYERLSELKYKSRRL